MFSTEGLEVCRICGNVSVIDALDDAAGLLENGLAFFDAIVDRCKIGKFRTGGDNPGIRAVCDTEIAHTFELLAQGPESTLFRFRSAEEFFHHTFSASAMRQFAQCTYNGELTLLQAERNRMPHRRFRGSQPPYAAWRIRRGRSSSHS